MSQSLVKNLIHLVYSTKHRMPRIPGESNVPEVKEYIRNQVEHHRNMSFQDELRGLLDRHPIEYDECYLWD
jgi:hypothetical protein